MDDKTKALRKYVDTALDNDTAIQAARETPTREVHLTALMARADFEIARQALLDCHRDTAWRDLAVEHDEHTMSALTRIEALLERIAVTLEHAAK